MSLQNTTAICTVDEHTPAVLLAVFDNCCLMLAGCQRNQVVTYVLHATRSYYAVKNIRTDVQQRSIYIRKISIQFTSVGLARTRPNYYPLDLLCFQTPMFL